MRTLSSSKKLDILVLVETSHGYGRKLIQGASRYVLEQGDRIDFECRGFFEAVPAWLKLWKGDGVICRTPGSKIHQTFREKKLPYVDLFSKKEYYDIGTDEDALGEMAANYFLERGFDSFACFLPKSIWWAEMRLTGFTKALEKRGFSCSVFRVGSTMKAPYLLRTPRMIDGFYAWLAGLPKPCALLAGTDVYGKCVLDTCYSCGIAVPEEIAVLGVDNDEWFCYMQSPQLSSICQDGNQIGYEAARLLYRRLRGEKRPTTPLLLPPAFIQTRQSTDIIAVHDPDMALALRFIREHLDEAPTVDQVTEAVGLSRRTLERHFFRQFGRTVKSEIMRLRVERSKLLLRSTTLPVASIAKMLTFASLEHFIKTFRAREGISPSEYRKSICATRLVGLDFMDNSPGHPASRSDVR